MKKLSVVVPVWNRRELVDACLGSLRTALGDLDAEVIVVDDASTDGAAELVRERHPWARLLVNETNRGFAPSVNRGAREARGELLLLLNSDTEVAARDLERLVATLDSRPELDAVAPRLVGPDGATQNALMQLPGLATVAWWGTPLGRWRPGAGELQRYTGARLDPEVDQEEVQPPAAAWLLRHHAWQRVGPLDEALELFFNDVDWYRRLVEGGGRMLYLASATVTHHGGASTAGRADFVERWQTDRLRYYRKHHGRAGAAWVKLWVGVTFADWWVRNAARRMLGGQAEPSGPTTRAFGAFLRA